MKKDHVFRKSRIENKISSLKDLDTKYLENYVSIVKKSLNFFRIHFSRTLQIEFEIGALSVI